MRMAPICRLDVKFRARRTRWPPRTVTTLILPTSTQFTSRRAAVCLGLNGELPINHRHKAPESLIRLKRKNDRRMRLLACAGSCNLWVRSESNPPLNLWDTVRMERCPGTGLASRIIPEKVFPMRIGISHVCGWAAGLALMPLAAVATPANERDGEEAKPRVVITADPELDDNNTIIRAILYSSDVKFEGLIYVSSQFHWRGDGSGTTQYIPGREYTRLGLCPCTSWRFSPDEHFIDNIVDAYTKAYQNLKVHDPDYPPPETLKSRIKWGNVDFDGDFSKDTDGSNLIKSLLLDDEPGPLYVTAQGGESTIARALISIHDEYAKTAQWARIRDKVSHKLIIIPSGDQDGTEAGYIRPNWPEVREFEFTGINFGYGAQDRASPDDNIYFSPEWTRENITDRGPLGALYRVWGDGKQMVKGDRTDYFGLSGYTAEELKNMGYMVWMPPHLKGSFLGEGDTPTFLNLV